MKKCMKKGIFLIVLLLLAINIAIAQEDAQEDAIEQVSVMGTVEGATVRLLQLQSSIDRNILKGTTVIAEITNSNRDLNISGMEELLAELTVLSNQISEMLNSDIAVTKATEEFVMIKQEATGLSQEFKKLARSMVSGEEQERLRNRNETSQELDTLKEEIRQRIMAHNALQVQNFLDKMDLENESLVGLVGSGQMNLGQAVSSIANAYKGLGQSKKTEALVKMKENKAKAQVFKETIRQNTENNADEMSIRAQERKETAKDWLEEVKQKVMTKAGTQGRLNAQGNQNSNVSNALDNSKMQRGQK
jgi:hypothetical protein